MSDHVSMNYEDRKRAAELKKESKDRKYREMKIASKNEGDKPTIIRQMLSPEEELRLKQESILKKEEKIGESPKVRPIDPLIMENIFAKQQVGTAVHLENWQALKFGAIVEEYTNGDKDHPTLGNLLFTENNAIYLTRLITAAERTASTKSSETIVKTEEHAEGPKNRPTARMITKRNVNALRLAMDRSLLLLLINEFIQDILMEKKITPLLRSHTTKIKSILRTKIRFNFNDPNADTNAFKPTPESTYSLIKKLLSQLNAEIKKSLVARFDILKNLIPNSIGGIPYYHIQNTLTISAALDTLTCSQFIGIERDIFYMRHFNYSNIREAKFKPEHRKVIEGYVDDFNLILAFFTLSCITFPITNSENEKDPFALLLYDQKPLINVPISSFLNINPPQFVSNTTFSQAVSTCHRLTFTAWTALLRRMILLAHHLGKFKSW